MITPPSTDPDAFLHGPNGLLPLPPARFASLPPGGERIEVSLESADKEALMDAFADAFALPAWFGRNWDALYDCLTDLSWRPETDIVLLLAGEIADAGERAALAGVLEDACDAWQAEGRRFHVCIDPRLLR